MQQQLLGSTLETRARAAETLPWPHLLIRVVAIFKRSAHRFPTSSHYTVSDRCTLKRKCAILIAVKAYAIKEAIAHFVRNILPIDVFLVTVRHEQISRCVKRASLSNEWISVCDWLWNTWQVIQGSPSLPVSSLRCSSRLLERPTGLIRKGMQLSHQQLWSPL